MKITPFFLAIIISLSSAQLFAKQRHLTLEPVIVTANPLKHDASNLTHPITSLSGDELQRKLQPTIGETLASEPGISSTYYGPNASRPVIRGQDANQIEILQNGVSNLDASATSADHNIAVDPLSIEKIEILRGPSALLYGPKAVGGVINLIDNRIPDQPIAEKITGVTDIRHNSANNERSASILLEGGISNYAWHLNSFTRKTDNLDIPGYARSKRLRTQEPLHDDEIEEENSLNNSQNNSDGVTVGVAKFFDKGYFGIAFTNYDNNYGIPGHEHAEEEEEEGEEEHEEEEEENVTINMLQQRFDLAGLYNDPHEHIKSVKYKASFSDYKHTEYEGTATGTIFKNNGYDSRVEITHNKFGLFEGVLGFQSGKSDLNVSGDEAFLPPSITYTHSTFLLEELNWDKLIIQLGARLDYQKINVTATDSFTNVADQEEITKSASLGFIYPLANNYKAALSSSYTERAPNAQELYSNGVHTATQTFESGNQNLDIQTSLGIDLALRKQSGPIKGEVNLFYNYFQDFIALSPTGTEDETSHLPIYNYINLPAEFYGAEVKATFTAFAKHKRKLSFEMRGDYLEARNRESSEHLPRITPARIGASAIYEHHNTNFRIDTDYRFAQNNIAANELETNGYLMLNANINHKLRLGLANSSIYLNASNLLNQEARNHTSLQKDTVPLAGRSIMIGLRTIF